GAGLHVCELELDRLELIDRLAECDPLARILRRAIGRSLRDPDRLRGSAQPRALERRKSDGKALAFCPDHVLGRHAYVLEDRRAGGRALDAELVLEPRNREARPVLLDDERGKAAAR